MRRNRACRGALLGQGSGQGRRIGRRVWTQLVSRGRAPRRRSPAPLDARDVFEGAAAGDVVCVELLDRARAAFAAACVGVTNLLNPSLIVVGGGIAEHLGDALFGAARQAIAIGAFPVPGGRVKIVPAALGPDVSLAGAQPLIAARFLDPAWPSGMLEPQPAARA